MPTNSAAANSKLKTRLVPDRTLHVNQSWIVKQENHKQGDIHPNVNLFE
jgi:hypothetical protein